MALTKVLEGGIADDAVGNTKLDLSENYAFTGTVTGAGGIQEYDTWRITTNTSNTTDSYITSNWERTDTTSFEKIGTGMTESSGAFSFPSTGKYLLHAFFTMQSRNNRSNQGQCRVYQTTNNSSYNSIAQGEFSGESDDVSTVSMSFLLDVTDTTNQKIKLNIYNAATELRALGSSSANRTYITFMKIGDT